jgi:hypothetical protein
MAAPTATDRITPTGRKMGIGGPTYITFASNPDISLYESSTKPPGFTMDDRKDNTTSYNTDVRTFSPGRLRTGKDVTVTCGYDPDDLQEIYDLLGVRDTVTVTLPTGTQIAFYGWLDDLEFNDHNEDDEPTVTLTIAQGNQDWASCVEQPPVVYPGSGTTPTC